MNEFLYTAGLSVVTVIIVALVVYKLEQDGITHIFKKKPALQDPNADQRLMKAAKRFASVKNYEVLGNTKISYNGQEYNFSAILLGFFGTIGIKAVDLQGDIYGAANDDAWVQIVENKRAEFANPLKELNGSIRFLKDLYREEKVKSGSAETLVVFSGKNVNLYAGKKMPCIKVDSLYKTLDSVKYLKDNGADVQAMKAAIEKYTVK